MRNTIVKLFLLLFFISYSIESVYSQKKPTKEDKNRLAREFARVTTGNTFSSIGNFASVSTGGDVFSGSLFFIMDDYNVLNIKLSGGAIDGVASLFKEGKLNTNMSIGFSYNWMLEKNGNNSNVVFISTAEKNGILFAIEEEKRKFQRLKLSLIKNTNATNYQKDLRESEISKKEIEKQLRIARKVLKVVKDGPFDLSSQINRRDHIMTFEAKKNKSDSIIHNLETKKYAIKDYKVKLKEEKTANDVIKEVILTEETLLKVSKHGAYTEEEIEPFSKEIKTLENILTETKDLIKNIKSRKFKSKDDFRKQLRSHKKAHEKKLITLEKKLRDLKPTATSLSWFSFGYEATNKAFSLFDESLPDTEQLFRQNYTSQSVFISYNHQSNASVTRGDDGKITSASLKNRSFFSIRGELFVTNNLSSLEKVEIINRTDVGTSDEKEKVTRQEAFSGNYQENLTNGSIYMDYYRFMSRDNGYALHLTPKVLMRENFKPISSFQIGILFPFKDVKKQDNIVNLEVFYKINDIFNTTNSQNSILNRNTIGVSGTFPFNF